MAKNASSVFGDDESNNDPLRQPRQDETADAGSPESDPTETPTAKPQRDDVDSSASRVRVPELRNLPFRTAREIANDTPSKMRWTVEGYAAPEIITELDGEIKHAGKTTWTSHMVKAIIEGERFMGLTTAKTKVVWLSEQTSKSF